MSVIVYSSAHHETPTMFHESGKSMPNPARCQVSSVKSFGYGRRLMLIPSVGFASNLVDDSGTKVRGLKCWLCDGAEIEWKDVLNAALAGRVAAIYILRRTSKEKCFILIRTYWR